MSFSGNASVVASHAALRLLSSATYQTALVEGVVSTPDGGGGTYAYVASSTSGCVFTASVSGFTLAVSAVSNGTLAVGLSINRGDTGASIGTISALGTGTGGTGTYTLNSSATITSMTFTGDSNSYYLVAADGGRWFNVGSYQQTVAEISAGVAPTNFQYQFGDPRRYGAVGGPSGSVPSTDDSAAWAKCVRLGCALIPPGWAFKVVTGASISGQMVVLGSGPNSQLYCDGSILTVTNGNNSVIDNIYLGNISPTLTIQRYVYTSVTTTCIGAAGNPTITVANANGIVEGMEIFCGACWNGCTVTAVSGTTITMSKNLTTTPSNTPITFQNYTFNGQAGLITAITQGSSAVVTSSSTLGANPWSVGNVVGFGGVVGMTQINGLTGSVTAIGGSSGAWTATVNINTSSFSAFTASGTPVMSTALATLAVNNMDGRYQPNPNDFEWQALTAAQQSQAQIGPVITLTGNHVNVSRVYGIYVSILFQGCSYSSAVNCDLKGGWAWGGIAFITASGDLAVTVRTAGNKAIGNTIRDHAYEGIYVEACDGCVIEGNVITGVGESGLKKGLGVTGLRSANNRIVACWQGGIDYQDNFPNNGTLVANSSSIGDYVAWCGLGGAQFGGSGWKIDITVEYNPCAAVYAIISDSRFSGTFRENCYANLNTAVPNTITVTGSNNIIDGVRAYNETSRGRTGYDLAVAGGASAATTTTIMNVDLRPLVVGSPLFTSGYITFPLVNVRTGASASDINGTFVILDSPPGAWHVYQPTYGTTVTIDRSMGNLFQIYATNGTAFTISNPIQGPIGAGDRIAIRLVNASGGALGAISWGTAYAVGATAFTASNGYNRTIEFEYDGTGYFEIIRGTIDIPNSP